MHTGKNHDQYIHTLYSSVLLPQTVATTGKSDDIATGTCCLNDVVLMSMRCRYVASTLVRRNFFVMYPLGVYLNLLLSVFCCSQETSRAD